MLGYEEALTRSLPVPPSLRSSVKDTSIKTNGTNGVPHAFYNTSAHFVWIGDRTRQLDGAQDRDQGAAREGRLQQAGELAVAVREVLAVLGLGALGAGQLGDDGAASIARG